MPVTADNVLRLADDGTFQDGIIVGETGEIQRTTTYGALWAHVAAAGVYGATFYDVALHENGQAIAVGGGGEIETSSNYGQSWQKRTQSSQINESGPANSLSSGCASFWQNEHFCAGVFICYSEIAFCPVV